MQAAYSSTFQYNLMVIDFGSEYVLENEKVLLTSISKHDKANLLHFSVNEPELWKYSLQSAAGAENLEEIFRNCSNRQEQIRKNILLLYLINVQMNMRAAPGFMIFSLNYKTLQLGYTWYGKNFQGTGLNKNCKYLLFEFAFEKWVWKELSLEQTMIMKEVLQQ